MDINRISRRVAAFLVGVLILIYVCYQVYLSSYAGVYTETAVQSSLSSTVQVQGYVIRQETVLTRQAGGAVEYLYEDGEKVASGSTVARVYDTQAQVENVTKLRALQAEIEQLESFSTSVDTYQADPTQLSALVGDNLVAFLAQVTAGNFAGEAASRTQLLYSINQQRFLTDEAFDLSARLTQLQQQAQTLQSAIGTAAGVITTPAAGYFVSQADGYETAFDYSTVNTLTVAQLNAGLPQAASTENTVGKIATNFEWYVACVIDKTTACALAEKTTLQVSVPYVSEKVLSMRISAVNYAPDGESAALILKCDQVDTDFMNIRSETMQLVLEEYSGIIVNQKAIHFATVNEQITDENGETTTVTHENVKGVYVLSGNKIEFVQVFTVAMINNYAICKLSPGKTDTLYTNRTIRVYDDVVIEGSDLYDGKIV